MAAVNLIGSYNYVLVALSVLIAMFASFAALDLAGRVTAAGGWTRAVWLLGGAGAMGTGIWSMHYIGMLAFILPIPVAYHWPTVLLSLLAAILASVVALDVVSGQKMGVFRALAGSVLMGAGISSMHYIGMAAMRLPAVCGFNSFLVVQSVVFAVLISLAALWITFHFRDEKKGIGWEKLAGAVVMGAAIPVMHYTGMAAASFTPSGMPVDLSHAASISTLGTAGIAGVTFIVLGLALLTSWMDRRFAAQALEAYLSEAQQLSHTGSFGWRVSTDEVIWSEETFRIFQYDRTTEPTVDLVLQRAHPEDTALVRQTLERARHDKKDFDLEHRLLMPGGSVKYLRLMTRAMEDASGNVEFVGAVMDITERKRAEEAQRAHEREHQELQGQLQQAAKMEAIGRLAGGIAHDFNNILGAILGYGELAQKNLEGRAVRRHVDQVMQAGARGKGLVERILAFSRSGLGERVPVHVQSVVEETLEILAASLLPQVRLEKRLDAGDTAVVGDATQLHQVAMNLCTNALQAMEHGGVLTVVLDRESVPERRLLSHGTLLPGPYVRLSVSDTGSGIPPAVLERMFDPFFTTKAVGDGTGLGLSLVHGIVADFGGAIDVTTQAGVGTSFTVWLPTSGETPRLLAEPTGELPQGNGETVMIIDDQRSLVALAEETLAALGYEPAGFDSSVAALQAFRAEPQRFDLVLTDETMPDMSGVELAREIRRVRPELPIVLMSGYSGAQLTARARAAGAGEVLRKPLVRRDIAEALARALRPSHDSR
jgi:NO-binding membrane sensor protein with MHYT domain/signal transduction histidine kinase/ActR/RegA family two-component response regulator